MLLRFTLPSIAMMILPIFFELDGICFSIVVTELVVLVLTVLCFFRYRKRYHYA